MLHSKLIKSIAAVMLMVAIFVACKKDAFSEKDAIAAQTTLLQTKFSYDLAIKQIDLQIQRSGDSAKIVIQNLVNSGATALEILKQTNVLAQILQNQTNALAAYRYNDSLARNIAVLSDKLAAARKAFNDSVNNAINNATITAQLSKQYSLLIQDITTGQPIVGATVSVLPVGTATFATATSDATGTARFSSTLIIDPASSFSISATNYASVLVPEFNFGGALSTSTINVGGNSINVPARNRTVNMYNATNTRNTIKGSILADLDLTNGDAIEGVNAQLVTFTQSTLGQIYQFPTLTDASGNFNVKVPDGFYTAVLPSTIKIQQKMFVNAWTDEDASSAIPRIDSTGTVLQLNTNPNAGNPGSAVGYYLSFPADVNGKTVIAASGTSFPNNNNFSSFTPQPYNYAFFTVAQQPFANRVGSGNRTDSILSSYNPNVNNLYLNNSPQQQAFDGQVRYRSRAGTAAQPKDTVPVSLVSLVPGWMTSPVQLIAVISASNNNTGRIENVSLARTDNSQFIQTAVPVGSTVPLGPTNNPTVGAGFTSVNNPSYGTRVGAGGVFNQAVMFTPTNRQVFSNLTGIVPATLYPSNANGNVGTNNLNGFTVNNGNTYYLPIEFRSTLSRDRTPR